MIALRLGTPDDAAAINAISGPITRDTPVTLGDVGPTLDERRAKIAETCELCPWIVAEQDGAMLGYTFGRPFGKTSGERWTLEVGIGLAPEARGKQLGTRLYAALLRLLEAQGYRTLIAAVTVPNPASEALHARFGFAHIGTVERAGYKLGEWRHLAWFQKFFGAIETPPGAILPVRDVAHLLEIEGK